MRLILACLLCGLLACQDEKKPENLASSKEETPSKNNEPTRRHEDKYPYKKVVQKLPNGIRFSICGTDTNKNSYPTKDLREALCIFHKTQIEGYSTADTSLRVVPNEGRGNAFVDAVGYAYNVHKPLRLSPDMIWLLICQGVSAHFVAQSEQLRPQLVAHAGKMELKIEEPTFKKYGYNAWQNILPKFAEHFKRTTKGKVHDKFVKNFSTTGMNETIAFQTLLLEALQPFYLYVVKTGCGIPYITLEGTPEDWRKIRRDVEAFAEYGLTEWIAGLRPILDEFVLASEGKINEDFWRDIYKKEMTYYGYLINGWCAKFFPYLKSVNSEVHFRTPRGEVRTAKMRPSPYLKRVSEGKKQGVIASELPNGCSQILFVWHYDRDGLKADYNMVFSAGFVGCTEDKDTHEVRPLIHWAVFDINAPQYEPKPH